VRTTETLSPTLYKEIAAARLLKIGAEDVIP
jgi:hypothetical protein